MRKMLNELFLHSTLHRVGVQSLLHNQLHRTCPLLPKHPHSILAPQFHPLENTRHAKRDSCCGTEGRGFKSRRSPQIFQALREFVLSRKTRLVSVKCPLLSAP